MLLFLLTPRIFAQPMSGPEDVDVDVWTARQGLPQHSVNGLAQTADGLVWLATHGGVASFDGTHFDVHHVDDDLTSPGQRFRDVVEHPDGSLWLAAEEAGVFRLQHGRFDPVWAGGTTYDLLVADDGRLWSASQDGARVWEGSAVRHVASGTITGLHELQSGTIVGTTPEGQVRCLAEPCGPVEILERLPHRIRRVTERRGGGLVAETERGLMLHGAGGWTSHSPAPARHVAWRDRDWVFDGDRLHTFDGLRTIEVGGHLAPRTRRTAARSTLIDREGGLWLGTLRGGLVRLQHPRSTWLSAGQSVASVVVDDATDTLLYGSCTTGLFEVTARQARAVSGLRCPAAWLARPGRIWWHGVVDQRAAVGPYPATPETRLSQGITSAVEGPWFSSGADLWWIPEEGPPRIYATAQTLGGSAVRPIRGAGAERVFVTLDDAWLLELWGNEVVRRVPLPAGGPARDVRRLGDLLLVGTYGSGLLLVRDDQVLRRLTPRDGLCDRAISHLFALPGNRVWFNSNAGVGFLDAAQLQRAAHTDELVDCTLVTHAEGNGSAGQATEDGQLYVPTLFGVQHVDTAQVDLAATAPTLVLQEARFEQHDLLTDGARVVGPGDLRVRVAGVHFDAPSSVRYRHRLRGHDEQWSDVTATSALVWTDLAPGAYTFEVMARARDGVWSEPLTLAIDRRPAWGELALVRYVLPGLLVVGLLAVLVRALARTSARNERLRREIRHRELAEWSLLEQQEENERVRRMLEANRRLEALGRLSGGIAHDFNNLLASASGFAEPLQTHADADVAEAGRVIMDMVARGAALTGQLLTLGQRRGGDTRPTDVALALQTLAPMLRRLIREDVSIEIDAEPELHVRIEVGLFEQILTNLVTNARDAIDGAGSIRIRADRDHCETGRWVLIDVIDDGRGLPPELVDCIFDPYVTTKDTSRGTGLGLATVQRAAHEAGGSVEVLHTEPGGGTTMRVRLPEVSPLADDDLSEPATAYDVRALRILVVDDNEAVMRATVRLLASAGHRVVGAADLEEAVCHAESQPLDLLVTDVLLPYTTGLDVRDAVRALHPDVPVVFITGHAGDQIDSLSDEIIVPKPFTSEQLLRAVAQVLSHPP